MTIGGAIAELQNLINADDVPFYYKGGIEKVIETISMEMPTIEVEEDCISKAYLEQEIENLCRSVDKDEDYWQGWNNGLDSIVRIIEDAPSAVVPKQVTGKLADDVTARGTEDIGVKATEKSKLAPSRAEGEWITEKGSYEIICSNCEYEAFSKYGEWFESDYCPHCGAKMTR